jgi:hypothetical protein
MDKPNSIESIGVFSSSEDKILLKKYAHDLVEAIVKGLDVENLIILGAKLGYGSEKQKFKSKEIAELIEQLTGNRLSVSDIDVRYHRIKDELLCYLIEKKSYSEEILMEIKTILDEGDSEVIIHAFADIDVLRLFGLPRS